MKSEAIPFRWYFSLFTFHYSLFMSFIHPYDRLLSPVFCQLLSCSVARWEFLCSVASLHRCIVASNFSINFFSQFPIFYYLCS